MKNVKKLTVKSIMLLVAFTLSTSLMAGTYSGGSGTVGDPYQIANWADLLELSTTSGDWGAHFIQTVNIDASASTTLNPDGSGGYYGFFPIGNDDIDPFDGSYDGQDHTIDALYINRPEGEYIGLFGKTDGATIDNIGLTNIDVSGSGAIGGLVGYNSNTNISNCYVTGSVSATGGGVGGLLGVNIYSSTITNCYTSCSVTGDEHIGGLIGRNSNSGANISYCYNLGNVTGANTVGGLVGFLYSGSSVTNCYNSGNITGSGESASNVGGLVGTANNASISDAYNTGSVNGVNVTGGLAGDINSNSTMNNCYSTGSVTATGSNYGGLLGANYSSTVTNSFWDTETSGQASSASGTGKTTSEMKDVATFTDETTSGLTTAWDFETNPNDDVANNDYWDMDLTATTNSGYPFLSWENGTDIALPTEPTGNPREVSILDHLLWISTTSSSWGDDFIQTADIDASSTSSWNGGEGFSPIGNGDIGPFTGSYDGQNYTINALYINRSSTELIGLFGTTHQATLKNLGLTDVDVTGYNYVGGLVGGNSQTNINNCYVTGSVSAELGRYAGGLIGYDDTGIISNCYNTGNVSGVDATGGLVGEISTNTTMDNCYSTGSVTASGVNFGGLIGVANSSTVTNSFWDTETSGQASSAGGTGKTTSEMKAQSTFTDAGWDFVGETTNGSDDDWSIDGSNNSGYPWLSFEGYDAVDITWDGSASADWNEKSNWSLDAVPTVQNNPIISSGVTQPLISATGTASCNNLTVNSGATLTIQSDDSNSGSLFVSGTATGDVTYNRWMTKDKWHIVSAPVETQTINGVLTDGSGTNSIAYKDHESVDTFAVTHYVESTNEWGDYYLTGELENFTSGVGYLMRRQTENGTVSFTGTVATGDVTSAVTLTTTNGWNAIGNPYTSAIGVTSDAASTEKFLVENAAILDDSYEALYVWNPATSDYVIVNNSGFTNNTGKTSWDVDYVQAGQGFIVRANANGNITFTTSMQKHQTSQVFKSAKIPWPGLVLKANKNDEMVSTAIAFNDDMTPGLDPGYDAGIFKGSNDLNIFTQLIEDNGVEFMLQCLPLQNLETVEIPIGLDATDKGDVSFRIEKNNFPGSLIPVLNDKLLETKFVFTADGDVYNTTINDNTKGFGRFSLTFASTTEANEIVKGEQHFKAWFSNGKINLYGETTGKEIVRIYTVSGQEIINTRLENTNLNTIELPIRISGIYLIQIEKQNRTEVLKVPVLFN